MLTVIFIRHGATLWNEQKKIQGQTDIALSQCGQDFIRSCKIPTDWHTFPWYSSPLVRAKETAELLGLKYKVEPLLREMDWGEWEGKRLAELRNSTPDRMLHLESQGLDLAPPGGETPRHLQQRLQKWANTLAAAGIKQAGAICHKGVIRAVLASACNWDMTGKPPCKLDFTKPQSFLWDGEYWQLWEVNMNFEHCNKEKR